MADPLPDPEATARGVTIRLDGGGGLVAALTDFLEAAARYLAARTPRPPRPGPFSLSVTGQTPGASTMIVTATLPARTAPDVATFELSYAIDGAAPVVATSTGDPIAFNAPVGANVVATFVEIDGSGNRSPASDPVTLVVADTIAPGKPGTFGMSVTGEEAMPDPAAVLAAGS